MDAFLIVSHPYGWKILDQILTTFSGLGTIGAGKVENGAQMTQFCVRNIPVLFKVQFLLFLISKSEKCFGQFLMTFLGLGATESSSTQAKFKIGARWLCVASQTYPRYLGCSSYHFPPIWPKKVSVNFGRLFQAPGTTRAGQEQAKLKIRCEWSSFAHEISPHSFLCSSYRFPLIWLNNLSVEFWRLLRARIPPEQRRRRRSSKLGADDYVLHPKHTHIVCGVVSIFSCKYGRKIFRSNFDDSSKPGYH